MMGNGNDKSEQVRIENYHLLQLAIAGSIVGFGCFVINAGIDMLATTAAEMVKDALNSKK